MATIQYSGWLFKDDGTAVDGATVALFEQGSTTAVGSSVTTGDSSWADGYWEITTTQEPDSTGSYYAHDVKITSGSSVRWLRGKTRQSFAEVDIRNATGATQGGLLVANNANTASNKVATFANRMRTGVDGDEIYLSFEMMNDADEIHEFARITAEAVDSANGNEDGQIRFGIADGDKSGDAGGIVDVLTLNTTTGGVTSVITDTISQYNNTVTVGVDDTGYDVKFFGASAGAYMLWDESADQLVIMGKSADAVDSTGKLLLATSLTNVNANDVLGKIEFQAPHETGTDATAIAAAIEAVAQGTFAAAVNATDLIFKTGHSEAATEKFRITSQGELGIGGATYGSSGDVLTSGGAGAAPTWETPTTGDITGVSLTGDTGGALSVASGSAGFTLTGGTGIDTSGSGTTVTFALDLSELTDTAIANGDYIVFTDTTDSNATVKGDLADVATLFAGTGLTASNSVIGVDASQTQITAVGTIATGEWNGDPITHAYIADDIVSGQDEITSGFAAADELMYSDGGVIKRVGLDVLATKLFSVATAGTVAQASDHMLFLDAGATGDVIVESIDDFLSAIAGSGISVSSSQLTASGGISESDAIALIMALG